MYGDLKGSSVPGISGREAFAWPTASNLLAMAAQSERFFDEGHQDGEMNSGSLTKKDSAGSSMAVELMERLVVVRAASQRRSARCDVEQLGIWVLI